MIPIPDIKQEAEGIIGRMHLMINKLDLCQLFLEEDFLQQKLLMISRQSTHLAI
jgi:hypothetical protein